MAFQLPPFVARLFRPFSTSISRPLQPDSLATVNFDVPTQRAIFGGGCFWGLEKLYRKQWKNRGLLDCRVGYTGGHADNPSYNQVCTGSTGHAEALLVVFNPEQVTYKELVEFFFRIHDPTQLNGQGNDIGTQYRSAIFTADEEQVNVANEVKDKVGKQWYPGKTITTEIRPAGQWYDAEDKHQDYLLQGRGFYECPAHNLRPHLSKLE